MCWDQDVQLKCTANHRAVLVATCADPAVANVFAHCGVTSRMDSFRVCQKCYRGISAAVTATSALSSSNRQHLEEATPPGKSRGSYHALILRGRLTSEGQPLLELFKSIGSGSRAVTITVQQAAEQPPNVGRFKVDDMVVTPRRKQAGVNEEGGVGKVTAVALRRVGASDIVFYSIRYGISGRVERDVDETLLTAYDPLANEQRRRSADAAAAGAAAAEERAAVRLQRENESLRDRVRNLEAQTSRDRMKFDNVRRENRELAKAAQILAKESKEAQVLQIAEHERMQRSVDVLLEEAIAAAQADAREEQTGALEQKRQEMLAQRREHSRHVALLEKKVQQSAAAHHRLEANVATMLQETALSAAAEVEVRAAELEADLVDARFTLEEAQRKVSSLYGAAAALGVPIPGRLTPNTGSSSTSLTTMGSKEKTALGRTAAACVVQILELVPGGAREIAALLQARGDLAHLFGNSGDVSTNELQSLRVLQDNVTKACRIYKLQKNQPFFLAFLSLMGYSASLAGVAARISTGDAIAVGMLVQIRAAGHRREEGVVTGMNELTCTVDVCERTEAMKRQRFVTPLQEAAQAAGQMVKTGETRDAVPLVDVSAAGSVRCTEYDVKEARALGSTGFPGKVVMEDVGQHHRVRKSDNHREVMANHFDDEEIFPLRYSSSKGATAFRALPMRQSYKLACEACRQRGCEEPRWEDYLNVLSSSDYTQQVPLNCVCSYCRILGLETFDEVDDLITMVDMPAELCADFIRRAKSNAFF